MTAAGQLNAGTRVSAAMIRGIAPLSAFKLVDEAVTSNVTLQNDDALFLPNLVANAVYYVECYLDYEGAAQGTGDIKWQWTVPTNASLRLQRVCFDTSGAVQLNTVTGGANSARTNGAGALQAVTMRGTLFMNTTPGTLQLQWAQNTSSATATIVHAQSCLLAWQIG